MAGTVYRRVTLAHPGLPNFWLNFHVGYSCRHSGACCTAGWPIPVERDRVIPIQSLASREDSSWLLPQADAPAEVAGTLVLAPTGECVFHGAAGCGVYAARPVSCAHFPFVCLIDQRGVHVTLSHYCPTAAAMLFEHHGPIAIVEGPPPVAGLAVPEGLDARESLPPLESPNRLMSFEAFSAWQQSAVAQAIAAQTITVDGIRFENARRAVPAPWSWPAAPPHLAEHWNRLVNSAWPKFTPVVQRFRAAHLFASWAAYTGDGIPAVMRAADLSVAVLRVEATRQCLAAGRALDAELLKQAIRQSDLLLVHYADGRVLSSGTTT